MLHFECPLIVREYLLVEEESLDRHFRFLSKVDVVINYFCFESFQYFTNWVVGAKMTNVWSRIAAFTHKYPLSRGMVSYACIWPLGSFVQQKIQGKEKLDFWRALRFSLYGCCFVAPTLYTWMTIAGVLFPKPGLRSGIYKVSPFDFYQLIIYVCVSR